MEYKVEWRKTEKKGRGGKGGRGMFALKSFRKGEVIEECPVISLSAKESAICETTILDTYLFPWKGTKDGSLPLGYGLLYNHSFSPNAEYDLVYKKNLIVYKALRSIKRGEEILVNYNGDPKNTDAIKWISEMKP